MIKHTNKGFHPNGVRVRIKIKPRGKSEAQRRTCKLCLQLLIPPSILSLVLALLAMNSYSLQMITKNGQSQYKVVIHDHIRRARNAIPLPIQRPDDGMPDPMVAPDAGAEGPKPNQIQRMESEENKLDKPVVVKPTKMVVYEWTPPPLNVGDKRRILIYTRWRFGSTLVGQLFHSHPDIFYLFEPLQMFDNQHVRTEEFYQKAPEYLSNLMNCKFQGFKEDANQTSPLREFWWPQVVCRDRTKACHKLISKHEGFCRKRNHIVTKLVKLHRFSALEGLIRQGHTVIILVRDPRGFSNSRKRLVAAINLKNPVSSFNSTLRDCSELVESMRYLESVKNETWFAKASIHVLRYEDIAPSLLNASMALYDKLGMRIHPEVVKWVIENSDGKSSTPSYVQKPVIASDSTPAPETQNRRKRSIRQPKPHHSIGQWRRELPMHVVKKLQYSCHDYMERFGYVQVHSEEELRDLNRPLLTDMKLLFTPA